MQRYLGLITSEAYFILVGYTTIHNFSSLEALEVFQQDPSSMQRKFQKIQRQNVRI